MARLLAPTLLLAGALSALTAAFFWPWPLRLGQEVADLHDPLFHAWGLAWASHALWEAPARLFDANIFHPHRLALVRSETMLGLVPLAAPFQALGAAPITVLNALVLLSFPLTGLGMFWLVRHLTGQAGPAVVAAILYAFSGYRLSHLGHLPLLHHEALPLMLLGLHRALAGGGRWRDVALAAGAFLALALACGYYAFLGAVSGLVVLAWAALPVSRPPLARTARRGLVATAVVALAIAPLGLALLTVRQQGELARDRAEVQGYSARPSSYLAAPSTHWLLGKVTAPWWRPEGALFPGVVTLALAAVGAATAFRGPARASGPPGSPPDRPGWQTWLDVGLVAVILVTVVNALFIGGLIVELGPLRLTQRSLDLWIAGLGLVLLARRAWHGRPVPLPGLAGLRRLGWPSAPGLYLALAVLAVVCSFGPRLVLPGGRPVRPLYFQLWTLVPGFDTLRVPARFAVLVTTALAVLAGYGALRLAAHSSPGRRRLILGVLAGLAVMEGWPAGLVRDQLPPVPAPVDRWLAAAPWGPVAVLPVYSQPNAHHEASRILGSAAHWRPLVNGYSSYYPRGYFETGTVLNAFPAPPAVARLRAMGVRYVVVYPWRFSPETRGPILNALTAWPPGLTMVAALEGVVIFELVAS